MPSVGQVLVKQLVKTRNANDTHYEVESFNGFNPSAKVGFGVPLVNHHVDYWGATAA